MFQLEKEDKAKDLAEKKEAEAKKNKDANKLKEASKRKKKGKENKENKEKEKVKTVLTLKIEKLYLEYIGEIKNNLSFCILTHRLYLTFIFYFNFFFFQFITIYL